jgi:hypothetical protein
LYFLLLCLKQFHFFLYIKFSALSRSMPREKSIYVKCRVSNLAARPVRLSLSCHWKLLSGAQNDGYFKFLIYLLRMLKKKNAMDTPDKCNKFATLCITGEWVKHTQVSRRIYKVIYYTDNLILRFFPDSLVITMYGRNLLFAIFCNYLVSLVCASSSNYMQNVSWFRVS